MWSSFVLLLFISVTIAWSDSSPWKPNTQYQYDVHVRTFSGIPKLRNQYAGVVSRGKLTIQSGSNPNVIVGQLSEMKDGSYHGDLENKYHAQIPSNAAIDYDQSKLNGKSFRLNMEKGIVQSLEVDQSMTNDQVNQLKGILSQLQMDLEGQNLIESPHNQLPSRLPPSGFYRTMEASVTGECETIYEISPLADYQVSDSFPHWTLDAKNIASGAVPFQIVKTLNYTNCEHRLGYQHGVEGISGSQSNKMGDLFSKSTIVRMIASRHDDYVTLHYATTISRITVSPEMHQKQHAMVVSSVELTLSETRAYSRPLPAPRSPMNAGSLVYRYNIGADKKNTVRDGSDDQNRSGEVGNAQNGKKEYNRHPQPWAEDGGAQAWYKFGPKRSGRSNANSRHQDKFWQPTPGMEQPASNPFAPYSIGHQGHGIQHEVKMIVEIEKLVNEIAEDLRDRNNIANKNSLEKYKIVVDLVAQASLEEIQAVDTKLQTKGNIWVIFRDVIAASGTGPTTKLVTQWIVSGRLQGAAAAHVLANQPKSIRTPTVDHIAALITIVKSPRVVKDQSVHTAAVFALAELVERSYFNRESRQSYYPSETYGPFYEKLQSIVQDRVIPYFEKGLQAALGNDRQVLVFLRAFGNLGANSYLSSFKKHFESKSDLTSYQRTAAVLALDRLTRNNPDLVRPVLHKIYENVAEVPETRAVAVLLLIESDPPVELLQRIASFTYQDPSEQVRSIVQSSIESIASLKNPEHSERASRAESARQFLDPRHYPNGYSRNHLIEYFVDGLNYNHQIGVNYLAGRDSAIPRMLRYRSYHNSGGYLSTGLEIEAMASSVRELMQRFVWPSRSDSVSSNFEWNHSDNSESQKSGSDWHSMMTKRRTGFFGPGKDMEDWSMEMEMGKWKWTGDDRQKRNYEDKGKPANSRLSRRSETKASMEDHEPEERFESQIYHELLGGHQFYTFDKKSLENLPKLVAEVVGSYSNGRKINYNKLYNAGSLTISSPLATGYPYVYTWDNPVLVQVSGNVQIQVNPPLSAEATFVAIPQTTNVSAQVHLVYNRNQITRSGFITTQTGQSYVAGHVRKTLYHAPLKLEVNVDLPNRQFGAEISPANPKQVSTLAHFSSWPYTIQLDSYSLRPDAENPGKKIIHVRPHEKINKRYGEDSTGMVFHVEGKYESQLVGKTLNGPLPHIIGNPKQSLLKSLFLPVEGLEQYSVEVRYDAKNSKSNTVKFGFNHKSVSVENKITTEEKQMRKLAEKYPGVLLAHPSVQNEWLQAAASNFTKAISTVANAWVTFEGPETTQATYEVMGAWGRTPSHDYSKLISTVRSYQLPRNSEHYYCLTAEVQRAGDENLARSSLNWANKVNHMHGLRFMLLSGSQCNSDSAGITGFVGVDQKYTDKKYIASSPEVQRCEAEMKEGNYQMPACQQAIHMARQRGAIMFELRRQGHQQAEEESIWSSWLDRNIRLWSKSAIVTKSKMSPSSNSETVLSGMLGKTIGSNSFEGLVRYLENAYGVSQLEINPWLQNILLNGQVNLAQIPYTSPITTAPSTCVVDRSQILTYDQRVLNNSIGDCVYVVTEYAPLQYQSEPNYHATKLNPDEYIGVVVIGDKGTPYTRGIGIQVLDYSGVAQLFELVGRGEGLRPSVLKKNFAESNQKPESISPTEDYYDQGKSRLVIYKATELDDNVVVVDVHGGKMRIYFDGERIKIEAAPRYRNQLKGLCGSNDQEKYNDLVTPFKVVYLDPKNFVTAWSIYDEQACSAEIVQQQKQLKQAESNRPEYIINTVVNEYEASSGRYGEQSEVSLRQEDKSNEQPSSREDISEPKRSSEEH